MISRTEKLESLQIVRAFAMILVLFIHLDVFTTKIYNQNFLFGLFTPGGDGGVDMFFVLSGFIIYYVHQIDINNKSKLPAYLIKRFSRIYPTYWLVTLFVLILHFRFPQFGSGDETQPLIIFNSFFLVPSVHAPIVHAAWTLVYEVLFYLSFAFLIFFGLKKMKYFIWFVISTTVVGWFYSINNIVAFQNSLAYVFFSYHNFEFLLGCFAAFLITQKKYKFKFVVLKLGIILFILMLFIEYLYGTPIYWLRLFGYGIPSFLIISSLASLEISQSLNFSKSFLYKFLIFFGNASFSIYLTHQVLISGIGRTLQNLNFLNLVGTNLSILFTLISTVIFGSLFYWFIERRLISFSRGKLLSYYKKNN